MYPNWEHWRDLKGTCSKKQSIPFVRHKEKRNMRRMPLGTCIGADNPDWFELELAGWQQAIKLMEDAVKLGK